MRPDLRFRHGRACPGHPRLACCSVVKTWMPGTRPGMTIERLREWPSLSAVVARFKRAIQYSARVRKGRTVRQHSIDVTLEHRHRRHGLLGRPVCAGRRRPGVWRPPRCV
ncbi:hypothetical protein DB459_06515 [Bradyrhizobium sp. WD16]|nr:hypothetical protein DB459_06515 [Bradyrhizobium sp. WD16]